MTEGGMIEILDGQRCSVEEMMQDTGMQEQRTQTDSWKRVMEESYDRQET